MTCLSVKCFRRVVIKDINRLLPLNLGWMLVPYIAFFFSENIPAQRLLWENSLSIGRSHKQIHRWVVPKSLVTHSLKFCFHFSFIVSVLLCFYIARTPFIKGDWGNSFAKCVGVRGGWEIFAWKVGMEEIEEGATFEIGGLKNFSFLFGLIGSIL